MNLSFQLSLQAELLTSPQVHVNFHNSPILSRDLLTQDIRKRLTVRLILTLIIGGNLLRSKSQEHSLPVSIIELKQQRTILIDAIGVARQTTLVHVNIMDSRSIRRSPDISSRLLVDRIGDDGIQVIQDIIVGTGYIVRENLAGLDIHQALSANIVKALQGRGFPAVVTVAVVLSALVCSRATLLGKVEALVEARQGLGDGVGEVAVQPEDQTSVLVGRLDVDGGLEILAGGRAIGEVEGDVRRLGVLPLGLSSVAGGGAGPDAVVGNGHVGDGEIEVEIVSILEM